jgi:hypothetical protein
LRLGIELKDMGDGSIHERGEGLRTRHLDIRRGDMSRAQKDESEEEGEGEGEFPPH